MPNNLIGWGYRLNPREHRDENNNRTDTYFVEVTLPTIQHSDVNFGNCYVDPENIRNWGTVTDDARKWYQLRVDVLPLQLRRDGNDNIRIYQNGEQVAVMGHKVFIFHMRHNLHISLSLIAQMLSTPLQRVTASAMGAQYVRICSAWGVTPYVSRAQERNRARAGRVTDGRSRGRQDNEHLTAPDYITPAIEEWFNNLDISFGHEIEVAGLPVTTGIRVMQSLPDIDCESDSNYRHSFGNEWKVVPDGSVSSGCEVVSPPMRNGVTDFLQVRRVMFALKRAGARITTACGSHVHFGVEQLTRKDRARIVEAHHHYQRMFDSFVSARRRGRQTYINPRSFAEMQMLVEAIVNNPASAVRDANGATTARGELDSYSARYRNLNVCSWGKYGTFENRQLQGCLNPKMMFAWLSLNRAFIVACSTGNEYAFGEQPLLQMADGMEVAHATAEQMLERVAELTNMPTEVSTLIKSFMD